MDDLIGKTTQDGWFLIKPAVFAADHTGGYFSRCFHVTRDGQVAFLKALNLDKFDIRALMGFFSEFQYEQDTLTLCRDNRMNRVVRLIEAGNIDRGDAFNPIQRTVPFIVFEMADGDIRDSIDVSKNVSSRWRFFVLHQTALGLMQLHSAQIAHQDLKPSNVLRFGETGLKLGDLGRSTQRIRPAPHDGLARPGHINYAPFEQRYNYTAPAEWPLRRITSDVFQLGTLLTYAFTSVVLPSSVLSSIDPNYHPDNWGGTYADVMPFLQAQLVKTVQEISDDFPKPFRDELIQIILDLCHVDPLQRGKLGSKNGQPDTGPLWLQRYVSRLDILEKKAAALEILKHA
ncbi:MAG: protein kinase [Burkholderiaceae bacterium]|nr:protein kinase [Burkholderiaceae bacterium]